MKKTNHYEICKAKLQYLNYSPKTQSTYLHYIEQFLNATKIPPSRLTSQDFQSYLDNFNFTSTSQQNQVINSIRFLYKFGLNKKYDKVSFKRPKSEKKLPKVVDSNFILTKLDQIDTYGEASHDVVDELMEIVDSLNEGEQSLMLELYYS